MYLHWWHWRRREKSRGLLIINNMRNIVAAVYNQTIPITECALLKDFSKDPRTFLYVTFQWYYDQTSELVQLWIIH